MIQRITAPSFHTLLTIGSRRSYIETAIKREEPARSLMDSLAQHRVVDAFREETVMFQKSEEVDPGIQTPIK